VTGTPAGELEPAGRPVLAAPLDARTRSADERGSVAGSPVRFAEAALVVGHVLSAIEAPR
jgi:hypothetical protein